jgi:hypothetical protein
VYERWLIPSSDADSLPEYAVKCIEIVRVHNEGEVKAKIFGPTHIVSALGCALSMILFAVSLRLQDGMALLAVVCLSLLSTLIGVGNKWKLNLPKRNAKNIWTPPGDVVIRYPKGSFLVVRCHEDVARELYFAPENLHYLVATPWKYRMISLVGTILLMFGVIFLGNAGTYLQIAFAGAYMILNAAYWIVAALPQRYHWDMSCFEVRPQRFDESDEDDELKAKEKEDEKLHGQVVAKKPVALPKKKKPFVSYNKTFTQALWKVIIATRDTEWIVRSQAAPSTDAWRDWLQEALELAKSMDDPVERGDKKITTYEIPQHWNPQARLAEIIKSYRDGGDLEKGGRKASQSEHPALIVPPSNPGPALG